MKRKQHLFKMALRTLFSACLITTTTHAQEEPVFGEIIKQKEAEFDKKIEELGTTKGIGYTPYLRWKNFWSPRLAEYETFSALEKNMSSRAKSGYVDETSCTSDASWTPVGPTDFPAAGNHQRGVGRTDWVKLHPDYDNLSNFTVYTGGRCGLFRSTDNGLNWSHLGSDKFASWGTSDVVVKPVVGGPDWLMTNTGTFLRDVYGLPTHLNSNCIGLRRSTDGGITWNLIDLEGAGWDIDDRRKVTEMMVDPSNPNRVYVVVNYFSWGPTASLHPAHPTIALTGNNADHWHGQVFVSENFGDSWTPIFDGEYVSDIEFNPGNSNEFYISGHSLYRGLRTGASYSYTPLTQNLTGLNFSFASGNGHASGLEIETTADNPDALYAYGYGNGGFRGLWYSDDRGASFALRLDPTIATELAKANAVGLTHQRMDLEVSQVDENHIYLVGLTYRHSTDGGLNWTGAPVHADVNDLEVSDNNVMFMANDGGVYRSLNSGASFTPLCNGLNVSEVYNIGMSMQTDPSVPQVLEAGMLDVTCMTYTPSGWIQPTGVTGDGMTCVVDPVDPSIVYNSSQNASSFRVSTDYGANFNTYTFNFPVGVSAGIGHWVTPYMLDPNNHERLIMGKHDLIISNTITHASDAIEVLPNSAHLASRKINALDVAPTDSDIIYVGYAHGTADFDPMYANFWQDPNFFMTEQLWVTQNGGTSWTDVTPPTTGLDAWITSIEVHPTDPNTAWVTYSGYRSFSRVIKTTDGGASWTDYSTGLPAMPANDITINPLSSCDFLYLATDAGVYYRTNYMSQWECFDSNLPNMPIMDLELDPTARLLRCATFGRGVWQTPLHPLDFRVLLTDFEYEVDCYLGIVKVKPIGTNPAGTYDSYTLWENNPGGNILIETINSGSYDTDADDYHLFSEALEMGKTYHVERKAWGDCIPVQPSTIVNNIQLVPLGLSPNFTYSVNCVPSGDAILKVYLAPQPTDANPFYQFDLYEYNTPGVYGAAVFKDTRASWQQPDFPGSYEYEDGPLVFSYPLNASKTYYIKHGVWDACQSWTQKIVYDIDPPLCTVVERGPSFRNNEDEPGFLDANALNIAVYPNPANDLIYVDRKENRSLIIEIIDPTGKILMTTTSTAQVTPIDLSELATGTYYIRSSNADGIITEKIIKN